jgi:hypothetical protein
MVDIILEVENVSITHVAAIESRAISEEVFDAAQNSIDLAIADILQSLDISLGILLNVVIFLSHCFVVSTPLRVMADCNSRRKGIVESCLLHGILSPVSHILEVVWVMRAG